MFVVRSILWTRDAYGEHCFLISTNMRRAEEREKFDSRRTRTIGRVRKRYKRMLKEVRKEILGAGLSDVLYALSVCCTMHISFACTGSPEGQQSDHMWERQPVLMKHAATGDEHTRDHPG